MCMLKDSHTRSFLEQTDNFYVGDWELYSAEPECCCAVEEILSRDKRLSLPHSKISTTTKIGDVLVVAAKKVLAERLLIFFSTKMVSSK